MNKDEEYNNSLVSTSQYHLSKIYRFNYNYLQSNIILQKIISNLKIDSYYVVKFSMKIHYNIYKVTLTRIIKS